MMNVTKALLACGVVAICGQASAAKDAIKPTYKSVVDGARKAGAFAIARDVKFPVGATEVEKPKLLGRNARGETKYLVQYQYDDKVKAAGSSVRVFLKKSGGLWHVKKLGKVMHNGFVIEEFN